MASLNNQFDASLRTLHTKIDELINAVWRITNNTNNILPEIRTLANNAKSCPCLMKPQADKAQITHNRRASGVESIGSSTGEDVDKINKCLDTIGDQLDQANKDMRSEMKSAFSNEAQGLSAHFRKELEDLRDRIDEQASTATDSLLNHAKEAIEETLLGAKSAIDDLKTNGGCPCLSQISSSNKGNEAVKDVTNKDSEASSSHCKNGDAAVKQLEASVATLTQLVERLTAQSPSTELPDSNDDGSQKDKVSSKSTGASRRKLRKAEEARKAEETEEAGKAEEAAEAENIMEAKKGAWSWVTTWCTVQ